MTAIKICGIRDQETMLLCSRLGVRWVGFNFFPSSPRFVTPEIAASISEAVPSGPIRVGLFVKPSDDDIKNAMNIVSLGILQIYDTPKRVRDIKKRFGLPVWLAKGIRFAADLPVEEEADGFIIEAPCNPTDSQPGGLGKTFDWHLTRGWQSPAPWLLAGGLTPWNVQEAIHTSCAQAVDVASGVEKERGIKSAELIEKFVSKVSSGGCFQQEG